MTQPRSVKSVSIMHEVVHGRLSVYRRGSNIIVATFRYEIYLSRTMPSISLSDIHVLAKGVNVHGYRSCHQSTGEPQVSAIFNFHHIPFLLSKCSKWCILQDVAYDERYITYHIYNRKRLNALSQEKA